MDHGMDQIAASILQKLFLAWWKTNSNIPKPPTVLRNGSNSPRSLSRPGGAQLRCGRGIRPFWTICNSGNREKRLLFPTNISVTRLLP